MNEARTILDADLSEAMFQSHVIRLAQVLGYRVAHFRPGRTADGWRTPVAADGAGFPDLVLVREAAPGRAGRVLYIECKAERGRRSASQRAWAAALTGAGAEYYLFRPRHWSSGEIERVLA